MDYIRKKLASSAQTRPHDNAHDSGAGKAIVIHPGEVEDASHTITMPGRISLEELRFWAYIPDPYEYLNNHHDAEMVDNSELPQHEVDGSNNTNQTEPHHTREIQDAYMDIVIFEFPIDCPTNGNKPCDLPSYGIGAIVDNEDSGYGIPHPHLSLCNETTGRLIIDRENFEGYHTTLHIPPRGYQMKDRITDPLAHKIPSFPSKDTQFEILFANCDTHAYGMGRNIELSGQILFEYDPSLVQDPGSNNNNINNHKYFGGMNDSPTRYHIGTNHQQDVYGENLLIDAASMLKLLGVALSVCIFFTMATCRIRLGTRSDYFRARMNEQRRLRRHANNDSDENNYSDDDNSIADDSEEETEEENEEVAIEEP